MINAAVRRSGKTNDDVSPQQKSIEKCRRRQGKPREDKSLAVHTSYHVTRDIFSWCSEWNSLPPDTSISGLHLTLNKHGNS
jgi:hypothetical protein